MRSPAAISICSICSIYSICAGALTACAGAPATPAARPKEGRAPEVREGLWTIRDTRLFVRDVGPKDAPVLVVVHGGPGGNHRSLRPLEALPPAHRVVLYDQRGTGRSDRLDVSLARPAGLKRLSLQENVEDLEALRRRIGQERIALIGHSWGAALAVFYAAAYPGHVERLVVYSGGPETADLSARKQAAHNARLTVEERAELGRRMKALKAAVTGGAPQERLDRLFTAMAGLMFPSLRCRRPAPGGPQDSGRGGFWANQAAGQYVESFRYETIAPGLKKLRAPALLTWGRCEPSPDERLTNLLDFIPDARFVVFEKSGHDALEEERELFFATLRAFLAGKPLPVRSHASRARYATAQLARQQALLDGWGDRLTRWLHAGRLAELFALFTPRTKQALPLSRLKAFQAGLSSQLGPERELLGKAHSVLPTGAIYRRRVRFAKLPAEMEVSWTISDLEGARPAIAGFHVREPLRPAPSDRLEHRTRARLTLPFRGRWLVVWGGRTVEQNYHARAADQRFAADLLVVKDGRTHAGDGTRNEQYHCFGQPVLAAGAGKVVAAENGRPDGTPGVMIDEQPLGNHVIIDHGHGEHGFYCHLRRGSVTVKVGDAVRAGEPIALCGNSGRSSEPHLHLHLQDSPRPLSGQGLPMQFENYRVHGAPVRRGEPAQGQVIEPGAAEPAGR